jgi:hypothetical protein
LIWAGTCVGRIAAFPSNCRPDSNCDSATGAHPSGFPIISYYELILPSLGRLKIVDCANPACTDGTISLVDIHGDVGGSSITIGSDGKPIISCQDYFWGDLKVAPVGP